MRNLNLFLFLFIIIGCNRNNTSSETLDPGLHEDQSISINSEDREYHLYIPPNATGAPIVFLFHGNKSSNSELIGLTNAQAPYSVWLDLAEENDIILAIPNGTTGSTNDRGWNDCRMDAVSNPSSDDVLFVSELIDFLVNTYDADEKRVYALGTSNGGHFSIRLAEEIPEKITAFGAIAASSAKNSVCSNSSTPVSAIFINGTFDPILPYEGGEMPSNRGEVESTDFTIEYWNDRNETDQVPETFSFPDIDTEDDCTAERFLYKNGSNGTEVALYMVKEGGHTEPSIEERYGNLFLLIVGNQNGDFEMAEEVWSFFETKSK